MRRQPDQDHLGTDSSTSATTITSTVSIHVTHKGKRAEDGTPLGRPRRFGRCGRFHGLLRSRQGEDAGLGGGHARVLPSGADLTEPPGHPMTERYDLHDEHGRVTGYVLRETPHHGTFFRSEPRTIRTESPLTVALCFALGAITLVATLAYL